MFLCRRGHNILSSPRRGWEKPASMRRVYLLKYRFEPMRAGFAPEDKKIFAPYLKICVIYVQLEVYILSRK